MRRGKRWGALGGCVAVAVLAGPATAGDLSFTDALAMLSAKNGALQAARLEEDRRREERAAARGL